MKEFAVYTAARFGIFFLVYGAIIGVLALTGGPVSALWPLLLAVLPSSVLSYALLGRLRARVAASVQERAARASERNRRYDGSDRS